MPRRYDATSPEGTRGVVDFDGGDSDIALKKQAVVVPEPDHAKKELERAGAREVDGAIEKMTLTRASKDLNRAFPRDSAAPVLDGRLRRALPSEIELRKSLSSRQRKARSSAKRDVLDAMPNTQHRALGALVSNPQRWAETNAALSKVNGDAVLLDDKERQQVQRVDRAIQSFERRSGRGHLVYTEVTMPTPVTGVADLPSTLKPGVRISFDRFTAATHTLHELDSSRGTGDVAFEIETTRGMYLGRSDSADDTAHILPRGIQFEFVGAHHAPYERPGRSPGERLVIQLRDVNDDSE